MNNYKSETLNNFNKVRQEFGIIDDLQYIETFYNAPGRYYHNMDHLDEVLCCLEEYKSDGIFTDREYHIHIITAIYHDIIYNPKAFDNEEKSAQFVIECTCSEDIKRAAYSLILFTKYNRNPENDLEEDFMRADMCVFEKDFTKILEFEKKIQKEYAWVPLSVYIPERIKVLEKIAKLYLGHKDNTCVRPQKLIEYLKNKKWNIGVYFGSFNPLHIGHKSIINQAENIFDKVILAKGISENVKTDIDQVIENTVENEIIEYSGLITDFIKNYPFEITIIRGLRNSEDLLYEQNFSKIVKDILPEQNIVYFFSNSEYNHISSSTIRKLAKYDNQLIKKYL